jgi:glycosidase
MLSRPVRLDNDPLWYRDAILYERHVKAFQDSSEDGFGDFAGLTQRIDDIQDLGVDTVWLLPFYPSPMRDDGYDISDYRNVHPDFGTRKDFATLVREAHRRGIRVITELVVNHTSDPHPWFHAARRAPPGSRKREYYVWSKTLHKLEGTRIIFTDSETSNWAWDPVAGAYYWHRFFSHPPDLSHNNPQVVKAMIRVMRFWLDPGVDGLRLDAVPYLCVREGTSNVNLPEAYAVIKQKRSVIDAHYASRMFLAESSPAPNIVPIAGALQHRAAGGTPTTLALLQACLSSQGDGWTYTQAYLDRSLREHRTPSPETLAATDQTHAVYRLLMQTLGRRTAELHMALARPSADPRFAPEPIGAGEPDRWAGEVDREVRETFSSPAAGGWPGSARAARPARTADRPRDAPDRPPAPADVL